MEEEDVRWEQRFSNFRKALHKLSQAVAYIQNNLSDEEGIHEINDSGKVLDEMVKEGLIQRFGYTHELAWNVMKDYAAYQGNSDVGGSRDAVKEAFQLKLIPEGKVWMDMIASRNQTSHTYNEEIAEGIYTKILHDYYPAFLAFEKHMEDRRSGEQDNHKLL